ncbi:TIGR02594 family protein [Hymenobacter mucosus]|uniref:TIGR02594 family protein n=1 Tax=Hymenobacter mucosus TaxID=1411120 RepID=A0A239AB18_9BACT|nr:TIGR02594 family protein [Hymenobacter mucosus]SNR92856.1 TIGR02594 family protein [Hymenobacter mucosus]
MLTLPSKYVWLLREGAPKILVEALKLYGTREIVGAQHSPEILAWARKLGMSRDYTMDETPWCGLFMAVCAANAGYTPARIALRAKDWLNWGRPVGQPMLGDAIIYTRVGGGHVGLYVGEDTTHYHTLGGNQGNAVCIARLPKSAAVGFRRSPFQVGQPPNVRRIFLQSTGVAAPVSVV